MGTFFVKRPVFAMVISIVIVIFGLTMMGGLPIAQYPEITPPEIEVSATYTGANALDVEQSVATPIEQKVNGVEGMIYMKSTNSGDGTLKLRVAFEVGTDQDMANVLTQNRVSEATASLPSEVTRQGIPVKKSLSFPMMLITLRSPKGTYDSSFLINYATINVIDAIARIQGVGQTNTFGGSEYAMRVWVKPDQLAKLSLTVPDITNALQEQNVIAPAGKLGGEPAPPGTDFTYTVQTKGRLNTIEEFENVIIRSSPDGSQVRIKDVARVELGSQNYNSLGRLNGEEAAVLAVYQLPGANGLELSKQLTKTMDELAERFPDDLEYFVSLDTTRAVKAGIDEIITSLFQVILLVILVVYIFLQNIRATLIPLITIPVALIGAFIAFPMLGFSINTISLLGLVLAIGTLVDDAIVVVEAVSQHIEAGLSPKDATVQAMKEVSGPVIATTLVLLAVFVPVGFMEGITGLLYQQFAITIAVSVIFSSINALTLAPALCALLLKPETKTVKKGFLRRFFDRFNNWLDRVTGHYINLSSSFIRSFRRAGMILIFVIVGMAVFGKLVPAGFMPEEDQGYFLVNVQLPEAASLQRSDAVASKVEKLLAKAEGVDSYTTITGYSLISSAFIPNNAFFFVSLKDWGDRAGSDLIDKAIVQKLNAQFAATIPEAIVFAFGPPAIPGLGTGAGFNIMLQDRSGASPEFLAKNTEKFIAAANQRPEIGRAMTVFKPSSPQVFADIDRSKVLKLGVDMADVNTALGAFLGGAYVNDFNRFGRLYKVYVQAEPEYRIKEDNLGFFFVRGQEGKMIPLSTLINTERTSGPDYTNRFNLFRAAEVSGVPAPGYSSTQALAALEEVAAEVLPPEMSYAWNAMSYQEKQAAGSAGATLMMAMLFVFLILAAQYESWTLPFSVLMGAPFSIFGAFAGLWFFRLFSESYVNNVFAQISVVLLIGLTAKNAILIVEFARVKKDAGMSAKDAAIAAARSRFRPILMTAFSSILGVIPLMIATGAGSQARVVMGVSIFMGMFIATVLGVCLVPAFFVMVEHLTSKWGKNNKDTEVIENA